MTRNDSLKIYIMVLLFSGLLATGSTANVQVMSTSPTNNATNILSSLNYIHVTFNSNIYGPSLNNSVMTCSGLPDIALHYFSGDGTPNIGLSMGGFAECGATYTVVIPPEAGTRLAFAYSNFSSAAGLDLTRWAYTTNNILRLNPAAWMRWGGAWYSNMVPVTRSFSTRFNFRILYPSSPGGCGFAISFHTNNFTNCGRNGGSTLGYGEETNIYSVAFTVNPQKVMIECGGRGKVTRETLPPRVSTVTMPNYIDGNIHTVVLKYVPGTLQVFMDDTNTPILVDNVSFQTMLNLRNNEAYIGFSSGTGATWEAHEILNWYFRNIDMNTLGSNYSFQFSTMHCPAWSSLTNLTWGPSPAWYPSIACDMSNQLHLVFQDIRGGNVYYGSPYHMGVYYRHGRGTTWDADKRISLDDGYYKNTPDVNCFSNYIYMCWNDGGGRINQFDTGNDVYFSKSIDRGLTWQPQVRVSQDFSVDDGGGPNDPKMAVDHVTGKICTSWFSRAFYWAQGSDVFVGMSSDKGNTWKTNRLTHASVQDAYGAYSNYEYPSLQEAPNGNFYLIWNAIAGRGWGQSITSLEFSRFNGTTWSKPSPILTYDSSDVNNFIETINILMPDIAIKDTNNLYAVFSGDPTVVAPIAKVRGIWFSRSLNGGSTWSAPVKISGTSTRAEVPRILYSSNNIYVVYEEDKHYAVDSSKLSSIVLATSTDNGTTWTHQTLVSGYYSGNPKIIKDKNGRLILVWEDNRTSDWRIYLLKGP